MNLVVQKFGGTSVGSFDRIQNVADLILKASRREKLIVVVSAMAGQTNKLVEMSQQISPRPHPEAYDMLLASGEQVSCALLAMALHDRGLKTAPLLSFQAGIETDNLSSNARIRNINPERLLRLVDDGVIPVVAGFQGISQRNEQTIITTLGRGGSDTSAVAIAIAVGAKRCDIFTDVDGVYTADPRIHPKARKLEKISFDEMMELASLGAKVLHMRCVELAAKYKMPLRVLSTFSPDGTGTTLMNAELSQHLLESPVVSSITSDSAECLLSVQVPEKEAQFPARFFRPLADAGVNVDVIVKGPPDDRKNCLLSFTVPRTDGPRVRELLGAYPVRVQLESTVKVSIVGIGMRTHSGVAATMFETLERLKIPVHLITTSEIKVSVLLDETDRDRAIHALHDTFHLDQA